MNAWKSLTLWCSMRSLYVIYIEGLDRKEFVWAESQDKAFQFLWQTLSTEDKHLVIYFECLEVVPTQSSYLH